jgi:hypothetical protein
MRNEFCNKAEQSLSTLKAVILSEWEVLVRNVITASRHESKLILLDHIPHILDQLILIMEEGKLNEVELGKSHGFYRLTMTEFTLADILTEYSLLREVLIGYLYPIGDTRCAKLIHKFIDILLKHSVVEYVNSQVTHQSLSIAPLEDEAKEILENPVIPTPNQGLH